MTSFTIAPADLDDPCSLVSKNDARVHGPCWQKAVCVFGREHDPCVYGPWTRVSFFDTRVHGSCWQKALSCNAFCRENR